MRILSYILSSVFGVGYFPFAPGTAGSAVATLFVYYLYYFNLNTSDGYYNLLIIVLFVIGWLSGSFIEKNERKRDPGFIVIDEFTGILVTFWGLNLAGPYFFYYLIGGFVLFRIFDIAKPYPISGLENVRGGIGIMADDFVAGIFANCILKFAGYIWKIYNA
ncbi:MAG: phosphatidylglycerophosphatase A [Candidatus Muiribacterium halophilum]|uniref:Phosphatidylglycerophosphatase A n=1 Tax=Muiribacterium halophilum TaxID=2053465 RepID=A0A2N5ZAQ7_MUIH1|nr:MAG: phosphatidylglycerophosphatase A [Candidatus Muirbacterium halophilum]